MLKCFDANSNILLTYKINNANVILVLNIQSFIECTHTKHSSSDVRLTCIAVYGVVFSISTSLPIVFELIGA